MRAREWLLPRASRLLCGFGVKSKTFSVFAKTEKTKLSNNARQTTTAAKRLYTWDTPS
jgi:hypothetical protein